MYHYLGMSFRLKQIGLSLCLLASLFVGSASACACTHHSEVKKVEEDSCHGTDHAKTEVVEVPAGTSTIDAACACFAFQPSPIIVSKSETKKSKAASESADAVEVVEAEFVSTAEAHSASPETVRPLFTSAILESLLPARAPPRL